MYDAAYVALAVALDCQLPSFDARLAAAAGVRVQLLEQRDEGLNRVTSVVQAGSRRRKANQTPEETS